MTPCARVPSSLFLDLGLITYARTSRVSVVPSLGSKGMSRWPEKPAAVTREQRGNRDWFLVYRITNPRAAALHVPAREARSMPSRPPRGELLFYLYFEEEAARDRSQESRVRSQQRASLKKHTLDGRVGNGWLFRSQATLSPTFRVFTKRPTLRGRQLRLSGVLV